MRRGIAVVVSAIACWLALGGGAAAQETAGPPTLAAVGDGRVFLTPDRARLYVGVERVRATSRGARSAANGQLARIRRTLRDRGVPRADVRTVGVSVTRERVHRRARPPRVRYRASAQLEVTARVRGLGALIDALADAGADDVTGPDFFFADPSRGNILATRAALADARRRADDAAARLGMRVTGIVSVDLAPSEDDAIQDSAGSGAGGSRRTRISPGREEISATVRVVYTMAAA